MSFKELLTRVAHVHRFVVRYFKNAFVPPFEVKEILRQCFLVGNKTLFLIAFTSFLAGIVFTKQSRPSLASFGAESWLPSLVSQAVVRSLGPLITGLICAGKLGSNIGAELASMKVSEQIDAMEVSGTRPFSYLVVSRVTATTLMLPILVIFSDVVSLLGSLVMTNAINNTGFVLYFSEAAAVVTLLDITSSIVKSAFFGFAIGTVSCYAGFYADNGTTGVGRSANTAVVVSMISIFVIDLIGLQILNLFRK
jgi:phospholipid/cholesterol/gamma-HCH transport system permease protein